MIDRVNEKIKIKTTERHTCDAIRNHLVEHHTIAECLPIASSFFASGLSRELRDVVYSYLCVEKVKIHIGRPSYIEEPITDRVRQREHEDMQPDSYAMDPRYMGESMAQEVAETYYSQNHFSVPSYNKHLKGLLSSHPLLPAIRPFDLIRKVDVPIEEFQSAAWLNWEQEKEQLDERYNRLSSLCMLSRRDQVQVKIELSTQYSAFKSPSHHPENELQEERHILNSLEVMRKPIYDLLHSGSKVILRHEQEPQHEDDDQVWQWRYLTSFGERNDAVMNVFQLTAEEWQKVRCHRHVNSYLC
ncbi:hypothetical protein BDV95DRAFT_38360 [Massariosphaeria phaeospora]|uniref:Uncharacterized protein n=1 Tax=Massariosphaeria phaeospora TaxID=100035 RepID=A0A7C8IG55_9PLEO|nr:hypothetical protein BDV95DRAFT_38360 [Massariosphaeria phaeospora]